MRPGISQVSKDYAIKIKFNVPIRRCRNRSAMRAAFPVGLRAAPIMGVIATTPAPPGGASDISHIVDGSGLFDPVTGLSIYATGAMHGRAAADSTFVSGAPCR
jgi:hypothetical protein